MQFVWKSTIELGQNKTVPIYGRRTSKGDFNGIQKRKTCRSCSRSISWWNDGSLAPLSVHTRNPILIFQETWESEGHPSHMINNPGCLTRSYAFTPSPSFSSRRALVTANSPYWLMLQLVKSPIPDTHGKTQCHRWIALLREEARPARHIYASLRALWIIVQHFVSLSNCCIADADFLPSSITVCTGSVDVDYMEKLEWWQGHNLDVQNYYMN